jgi:hypothetical protein
VIVLIVVVIDVIAIFGGYCIDPPAAKVIVILVDELGGAVPLLDHFVIGGGADEGFFSVVRVVSQFDDFGTLPGDTDA